MGLHLTPDFLSCFCCPYHRCRVSERVMFVTQQRVKRFRRDFLPRQPTLAIRTISAAPSIHQHLATIATTTLETHDTLP